MAENNLLQHRETVVPSWNRLEVNRYMLPVLRAVDRERQADLSEQECRALIDQAKNACRQSPEAYRQLSYVWCHGETPTLDRWFGWIECEDALLDEAFDFINAVLHGEEEDRPLPSLEQELYFSSLFQIHEDGKTIDLSEPFEQYYFCDVVIYRDARHRRIELGEKCKEWIRRYRQYYQRIRSWYRKHGEFKCPVSTEHHEYMKLYDHLVARMEYEERLQAERKELEYEHGGLGWFRGDRKREIAQKLYEIELEELELRLENALEKYEAYEEQFESTREGWEDELVTLPLTAFARRRELKNNLVALNEQLDNYRRLLDLDNLQKQYDEMSRRR